MFLLWFYYVQQESIPVGCVTSAAVTIGGGGVCLPGGCLPQCMLGYLSQGCLPQCMLGYMPGGCLPQCMLGYTHPPCGQNSWHTLVKTLPFRTVKTNLDVTPAEFLLFSFWARNITLNIFKVESINHDCWIGQADPLNSHAQNRSQECAIQEITYIPN